MIGVAFQNLEATSAWSQRNPRANVQPLLVKVTRHTAVSSVSLCVSLLSLFMEMFSERFRSGDPVGWVILNFPATVIVNRQSTTCENLPILPILSVLEVSSILQHILISLDARSNDLDCRRVMFPSRGNKKISGRGAPGDLADHELNRCNVAVNPSGVTSSWEPRTTTIFRSGG